MQDIIVAVITGGIALVGTTITVIVSNNSVKKLMEYRIEQIEKSIEKYHNHGERLTVLEQSIKAMWDKVDYLYNKAINEGVKKQ